jgi:flagellar motility protein MotE (MotC chaperone)
VSSRLRTFAHGLLWFAAVNFAAIVVGAVALGLLGAVEPARWRGALQVLRGSAESVPAEELDRLRGVERRYAERLAIPEERVLLASWRKLRAERWALLGRAAEQWARLAAISWVIELERSELDNKEAAWRLARQEADRERLERQQQLEMAASQKVQKLYRYMSPGSIAADLENRMDADQAREVAQIVKAMPERSAAEVLEAFVDPRKRNRIYDLMAGRSSAAHGGAARATP